MSEEIRRFVMDVNESIMRQVATKCTAQELTGMDVTPERREITFNHYLGMIKGI